MNLLRPLLSSTDLTVTDLLVPLVDIDDRGVYFEDSFASWRDHVLHAAAIAATLRERLDPAKPPHVGVLLENTPFFSAMLVAAGMSGIVPVGLNPVRRGEALARDISKADCQLVLADTNSAATLDRYLAYQRRFGRVGRRSRRASRRARSVFGPHRPPTCSC